MKLFENVLDVSFKEKYKEYCYSIRNNIISAYYDIEFLNNITPYTSRHKVLESTSYKLIGHIISLFWQDLILNMSKMLETGKNAKSIWNLRSEIRENAIFNFRCEKWNINNTFREYIIECRTNVFAHSLFNESSIKIQITEIEQILSGVLKAYNNFQFQLDNINYFLTDKEIQQIKSNCNNGIKGLIKPSVFDYM